jgi:HD superfamily phosphohydrolase
VAWLKDKKKLTVKQTTLLKQLEKSGTVIHEGLGHTLAACVLDDLLAKIESNNHKLKFDIIRIKYLTIAILEKKNEFFKSVSSIISGDFDADRIDYASRDTVMCGLRKAPIDTARLVDSFYLMNKVVNTNNNFVFAPSTRSLSTIEEVYRRRFNVYKYAIYHNRVVKFDTLLQACVVDLAKINLDNHKHRNQRNSVSKGLLHDDISGLWEVFESNTLDYVKDRIDSFIQWDDAWLLSVLRRHYFEHPARQDISKVDPLFFKLQELLSNRKWYHSLFKRVDTFSEVECAFLNNIPSEYNWKSWNTESEKSGDILEKASEGTKACMGKNQPLDGFFLNKLFETLIVRGKTRIEDEILKKACHALEEAQLVKEAFYSIKRIKPGLKPEFILADSFGKPLRIGQVSRVVVELREAGRFFPTFFVFVRPLNKDTFQHQDLVTIRQEFGKLLSKYFCLLDIDKYSTLKQDLKGGE